MTSAARIAANRKNAVRSSGPRTANGKARSRQNAFRHGLSLPIATNDAFSAPINALAADLANKSGLAPAVAYAVAEARAELIRARQAKIKTIEQAIAAQEGTPDGTLHAQARLALAAAAKASLLASFARYERRASSRLRKRLRMVDLETSSSAKRGNTDRPTFPEEASRELPLATPTHPRELGDGEVATGLDRSPSGIASADTPVQQNRTGPAPTATPGLNTIRKFGRNMRQVFLIEPTLPETTNKGALRKAALEWHCALAHASVKPGFGDQQLKRTRLIQRLTDIARRQIQEGAVNEAICHLDAGLLVFSSSAFLAAMRACAGLIVDRPSGLQIIEQYKCRKLNKFNWEDLVFYQLDILCQADGMREELFAKVENALSCTSPSKIELRKMRRLMEGEPGAQLPFPVYEWERTTSALEQQILQHIISLEDVPELMVDVIGIYRPIDVQEANTIAGRDYLSGFLIYFRELEHSKIALARKRETRANKWEALFTQGYFKSQVANICLWLLQCGRFERVLSTVLQTLLYFPGHSDLHACRAAALMFLKQPGEASALYNRLIETESGIAGAETTLDALQAAGWENPLIDDVRERIRRVASGTQK